MSQILSLESRMHGNDGGPSRTEEKEETQGDIENSGKVYCNIFWLNNEVFMVSVLLFYLKLERRDKTKSIFDSKISNLKY